MVRVQQLTVARGIEGNRGLVIVQRRRDQDGPIAVPPRPMLGDRQIELEPGRRQGFGRDGCGALARQPSELGRGRPRAVNEVALKVQLVLANGGAVEVLLEPMSKRGIGQGPCQPVRNALELLLIGAARGGSDRGGAGVVDGGGGRAGAISASHEHRDKPDRRQADPAGHTSSLGGAPTASAGCDGAPKVGSGDRPTGTLFPRGGTEKPQTVPVCGRMVRRGFQTGFTSPGAALG